MPRIIYPLLLLTAALPVSNGVETQQAKTTSLESFLEQVGKQYDVFFTLELTGANGWQSRQNFESPSLPPDLKSALVILTNVAPAFAVMTNVGNARVYHVMDKRLLETNDYAMSRVLDSVVFHGNAYSFISYLHERVPPLSDRRRFAVGSAEWGDVMANELTKISIDETHATVRAALSDGIDPHTCKRIVWTSLTSPDLKSTAVTYHRKSVSKKSP